MTFYIKRKSDILKFYLNIIIVLLVLMFMVGCTKTDVDKSTIEFYILERENHEELFIKRDVPVFTDRDIKKYNWETHEITFTDEFNQGLNIDQSKDSLIDGGSVLLDVYYPSKFEIYVDDIKIYGGVFKPGVYISYCPDVAVISDIENGILIDSRYGNIDMRDNDILYKALEKNDLLK